MAISSNVHVYDKMARCLGIAFLFVNSYRKCPVIKQLPILPWIDEAAKDFWITFRTLGFHAVIYGDLSKEEFDQALAVEKKKLHEQSAANYVVFYFIGHGGDGDVLFMEDGGEVKTKEVVEGFTQFLDFRKVFFIDACRGTGLMKDPYCLTLPNTILARSTLPYQTAYTSGTYGRIVSYMQWCITGMV